MVAQEFDSGTTWGLLGVCFKITLPRAQPHQSMGMHDLAALVPLCACSRWFDAWLDERERGFDACMVHVGGEGRPADITKGS